MLGVVLVSLQEYIGIPVATLYLLAAIPCVFALLDIYFYNASGLKTRRNLRIVAACNVAYCVLSTVFGFQHAESITILGITYITIEIFIVLILAVLEVRVSNSL